MTRLMAHVLLTAPISRLCSRASCYEDILKWHHAFDSLRTVCSLFPIFTRNTKSIALLFLHLYQDKTVIRNPLIDSFNLLPSPLSLQGSLQMQHKDRPYPKPGGASSNSLSTRHMKLISWIMSQSPGYKDLVWYRPARSEGLTCI